MSVLEGTIMKIDYEVARARMIKEQLISRDIRDKALLKVMGTVPRHVFVDGAFWPRAYGDYPLPIQCDQTISQPYIVALMCQELGEPHTGKVLEIGTGSGYQTAILALLGYAVYTVEWFGELSRKAEIILEKLGITSVRFMVGDGSMGWKEHAPFNGIVVAAGAPSVPDELIEQLALGGRIVIPVGDRISQRLQIIEKGEKFIEKRDVCGCTFVPLVGERGWKDE